MGKHDKTLSEMLRNPIPSNIRWKRIESLIVHYGADMEDRGGSAVTFHLNGVKATFHRPHPGSDADKGAVASALTFLRRAGVI